MKNHSLALIQRRKQVHLVASQGYNTAIDLKNVRPIHIVMCDNYDDIHKKTSSYYYYLGNIETLD